MILNQVLGFNGNFFVFYKIDWTFKVIQITEDGNICALAHIYKVTQTVCAYTGSEIEKWRWLPGYFRFLTDFIGNTWLFSNFI